MTYEKFIDFVQAKCMYETIYKDSEGRLIFVIDMLSAYDMVKKATRTWFELDEEQTKLHNARVSENIKSINRAIGVGERKVTVHPYTKKLVNPHDWKKNT